MAKSKKRLEAIKLRRRGNSIKKIAKTIGVAQSSVSLWCRNIALTEEQQNLIVKNGLEGLRLGQLKSAELRRKKRIDIVNGLQKQGVLFFKKLTRKEFFVFGLALYVCEGSKTHRRFIFTNSDPKLIKIVGKWLYEFYGIGSNRLGLRVQIHEMHKPRERIIKAYWKKYLNLPFSTPIKVNYIKTVRQKIYENYDSYYGTMYLKVLKGTVFSYKIQGLIHGLISRLDST